MNAASATAITEKIIATNFMLFLCLRRNSIPGSRILTFELFLNIKLLLSCNFSCSSSKLFTIFLIKKIDQNFTTGHSSIIAHLPPHQFLLCLTYPILFFKTGIGVGGLEIINC